MAKDKETPKRKHAEQLQASREEKPARILIVEDEEVLREGYKALLSVSVKPKPELIFAENPAQAITALKDLYTPDKPGEKPAGVDIIITDQDFVGRANRRSAMQQMREQIDMTNQFGSKTGSVEPLSIGQGMKGHDLIEHIAGGNIKEMGLNAPGSKPFTILISGMNTPKNVKGLDMTLGKGIDNIVDAVNKGIEACRSRG